MANNLYYLLPQVKPHWVLASRGGRESSAAGRTSDKDDRPRTGRDRSSSKTSHHPTITYSS